MFKPNLNKILNNFNKTITQLDRLVDLSTADIGLADESIERLNKSIEGLEFDKNVLRAESKRAQNVSKKLKDLIGG